MGKYSDMVLLGDIEQEENPPEKGKKASDMVLGIPDIEREYTSDPNVIDTRTAKPVVNWTPTGKKGPSFGTSVKSGFVDDPMTKIKIYAKARGIPVSRYRIHNGEIVYKDNDGKWYAEEKNMGAGKIKQVAGEMVPQLPSMVMGAAGAAAGPKALVLSPLLAAGGEGIRKAVGNLVFDEPQTTKGNLLDMGKVAAMDMLFQAGGKAVTGAANLGGRKLAGNIAAQAGGDLKYINKAAAKSMKDTGESLGIDLFPPQTTGSKKLADKFNLLGDIDASSPIIQAARKRQQTQIQNAVDKFLDVIGPDYGKIKTGQKVKDAAGKAIEKPVLKRQSKASPLYKKAFDTAKPVDTTSPLNAIDELFVDLPEGKTAQREVLSKIKRMLLKEVKGEEGEILVPQDNLKVLDNAKKAIDKLLNGPEGAAVEADMKRRFKIIKNKLVTSMDESNPDYAKARKIFEDYSSDVKRQGGKTMIGSVAKLEDDQVADASRKLFKSVATTPNTVKIARKQIMEQDPKAWDAALRTYMQDIFEKQKSSAGGVDVTTNIGGMFFKRTYGDPAQRKIFKAAMSESQYDYFKKLSKVLDRAGMVLRKESATATRTEMMKEIAGKKTTRVIEAQTRPLLTKWRLVGDWFNKYRLGANARDLAEAMTTEKGHNQLNRVYRLGFKSERFIPALSVFLGTLGTGALKSAHGKSYPEDALKTTR